MVGGYRTDMTRLVDIDTHGFSLPNIPLDMSQDLPPEDDLMGQSTVEVFPEPSGEAWENCYLNPDFPQLDRLRDIVRTHGKVLFQHFDHEGLRVKPLHLHVRPNANFKMQPCRFVRPSILEPSSTSSLRKMSWCKIMIVALQVF
jgi:hypothetical protein